MNVSVDASSLVIIFKKMYPSNIYRFNYNIHKQKFKVELLIIVAKNLTSMFLKMRIAFLFLWGDQI